MHDHHIGIFCSILWWVILQKQFFQNQNKIVEVERIFLKDGKYCIIHKQTHFIMLTAYHHIIFFHSVIYCFSVQLFNLHCFFSLQISLQFSHAPMSFLVSIRLVLESMFFPSICERHDI